MTNPGLIIGCVAFTGLVALFVAIIVAEFAMLKDGYVKEAKALVGMVGLCVWLLLSVLYVLHYAEGNGWRDALHLDYPRIQHTY